MRVIDRLRRSDVAIPVGLWLVASVVARAAGFTMTMPWIFYQLLDAPVLAEHPLASLCYLHSQPPVLNALVAIVLRTADAVGTSPERVAGAAFAAMGATAAVVLYRTVRVLTRSTALAVIALVLELADPAHHVYAGMLFYEFPLHVLLVLLFAATVRYLQSGERSWLLVVTLLLATISATRTLFHPVWAVGFWCLVVWLRVRVAPPFRGGVLGSLILLLTLLVAWPAKNAVVYGRFFEASMSAFSLARGVPGCTRRELLKTIPDTTPIVERATRICGADGAAALTAPLKSNRYPNFNWVLRLAEAPGQEACAVAWAEEHPGEWLRRAAGQYALWMRPGFEMANGSGDLIGPASPIYAWYANAWRRTVFADLRPFVEARHPDWFLHRYAVAPNGPVPYTLLGFVVFPVFLAILVAKAVRRRRDVGGASAIVLSTTLLTPMIAACLTDGLEGNRFRFATSFLGLIGACWLLAPGPFDPRDAEPGQRQRTVRPSLVQLGTGPGNVASPH
jgi:hypothetical protein